MSKTFETNALKGKSLAAGMKQKNSRRKIIKQNYLQDQWAGFGSQDKR